MSKRKAEELEQYEKQVIEASERDSDSEDSEGQSEFSSDSGLEDEIDEFGSEELENETDDEKLGQAARSSDEEDSDSDLEDGDDNEVKKPRISKQDQFSKAFTAILGSRIKAHERADPILVRAKSKGKEIESGKLDAKAKRALNQDRKALEDQARVRNLLEPRDGKTVQEIMEHERKLKKIAQRGVVRLFNAVTASQQLRTDDQSIGLTKKEEKLNEMSKDKFLELIKAGGKISAD